MIRHGSRHSGLYVGVTFIVGSKYRGSQLFAGEGLVIVSVWFN